MAVGRRTDDNRDVTRLRQLSLLHTSDPASSIGLRAGSESMPFDIEPL